MNGAVTGHRADTSFSGKREKETINIPRRISTPITMNEEQMLRDPDIEPSDEVIEKALGASYGAYIKFTDGLKDHNIQTDWQYYGDGKAWLGKALYKWTNTKGTQKETTAFWLSVWDGFFKVSIFVPNRIREDAADLPVSPGVKEMISSAEQMGKLKFFPLIFELRSDELFNDIYAVIDLCVKARK